MWRNQDGFERELNPALEWVAVPLGHLHQLHQAIDLGGLNGPPKSPPGKRPDDFPPRDLPGLRGVGPEKNPPIGVRQDGGRSGKAERQ